MTTETSNLAVVVVMAATMVVMVIEGHINRRHNRQIAQFQKDPSAGLIPPRSPVALWSMKYLPPIFNVGTGIYWLARAVKRTGPITRSDIAAISLNTGLIFFGITLFFVIYSNSKLWEGIELVVNFLKQAFTRKTDGPK